MVLEHIFVSWDDFEFLCGKLKKGVCVDILRILSFEFCISYSFGTEFSFSIRIFIPYMSTHYHSNNNNICFVSFFLRV